MEYEDNEMLDDDDIIEVDATDLVVPSKRYPEQLALMPVYNRPFFPAQVQPVIVDREQWESTIDLVSRSEHQMLGLVYASEAAEEDPEAFHPVGTIIRLHKVRLEEDRIHFIAQGLERFEIQSWDSERAPFLAKVSYSHNISNAKSDEADDDEIRAYAMALIATIKELIPLNPLYSEELKHFLNRFNLNDPSPLADFGAAITTAEAEDLQEILATFSLRRRMEKVLVLLRKELEVAKLQGEIQAQVNEKMSEQQREFFLREQLKVIQRELGISKDDRTADGERFSERMRALSPPEHVLNKFEEELEKLQILETGSPEYGVTRNYLDWISSVPWGKTTQDNLDLAHARKALDNSHAGLGDVKERILEFIAEGAFRGSVAGSIILLVGPPGVGKTSIGRAVADSLKRKFFRFSVGGMRDEAEIKGHRRTYVGAMPGKLVQALKDVGSSNPVIVLDEIDKVGASYQGDPASALLEVLDPEQNREFLDHYLDLRLDLSQVLFVCTANQLDSIPRPLLDRMDVIRLSGYITEEKTAIARQHLWPKLLKKATATSAQLRISNGAIRQVIEGYAREAGVRGLEKQLHKVVRKAVVQLLDGAPEPISVNTKDLPHYLGAPLFRGEKQFRGVGVVTGLAWTSMGGATLPIEANVVHERRAGFKVTGQLGDVMQESTQIACSYVQANTKSLGLAGDWFDERFVHIHVPEGATPKDGPSAGVTLCTALVSLASGKRLNDNWAMTGELTLTGKVLAVGGIREKVIAAKRLKISKILLPEANRSDFEELPEHISEGIDIHFARDYSDVFRAVF